MRELESLPKLSDACCAKLQYKLQDLLRRVYGPKNERLNPDQRALFGIPAAGEIFAPIQFMRTSEASNAVGRKRKRGGRRPKPQNRRQLAPVHLRARFLSKNLMITS